MWRPYAKAIQTGRRVSLSNFMVATSSFVFADFLGLVNFDTRNFNYVWIQKKYEMCFWGFVKNIMWLDSNWIGTYGIIIIIARYIKPLFDLAGDLSPHSSIEEMCVSFLRGVATPGLPIHGAPWILSGTPRCPRKNCSGI